MKQTRSLSEFTWCPKLPDFTLPVCRYSGIQNEKKNSWTFPCQRLLITFANRLDPERRSWSISKLFDIRMVLLKDFFWNHETLVCLLWYSEKCILYSAWAIPKTGMWATKAWNGLFLQAVRSAPLSLAVRQKASIWVKGLKHTSRA